MLTPMFQHPQRQRGMQGRRRRDRYQIWLRLTDHLIQIRKSSLQVKLISQAVQYILEQITQPHYFCPRMRTIHSGGGRSAGSTS
jgi:hypothetical protein